MILRKVDPTIKKETSYIALTVVVLSALMEAVFLIIGRWDYKVLLGNILGGGVGILNFFLMGLGLQSALDKDEKEAKNTVKFSHSMRYVLIAAVIVLAFTVPVFNSVSTIASLLFPTLGVYAKAFKLRKSGEEEPSEGISEAEAQE